MQVPRPPPRRCGAAGASASPSPSPAAASSTQPLKPVAVGTPEVPSGSTSKQTSTRGHHTYLADDQQKGGIWEHFSEAQLEYPVPSQTAACGHGGAEEIAG